MTTTGRFSPLLIPGYHVYKERRVRYDRKNFRNTTRSRNACTRKTLKCNAVKILGSRLGSFRPRLHRTALINSSVPKARHSDDADGANNRSSMCRVLPRYCGQTARISGRVFEREMYAFTGILERKDFSEVRKLFGSLRKSHSWPPYRELKS